MREFLNYLLRMHPLYLGLNVLLSMAVLSLIIKLLKWPLKILLYVTGAFFLMYACSFFV